MPVFGPSPPLQPPMAIHYINQGFPAPPMLHMGHTPPISPYLNPQWSVAQLQEPTWNQSMFRPWLESERNRALPVIPLSWPHGHQRQSPANQTVPPGQTRVGPPGKPGTRIRRPRGKNSANAQWHSWLGIAKQRGASCEWVFRLRYVKPDAAAEHTAWVKWLCERLVWPSFEELENGAHNVLLPPQWRCQTYRDVNSWDEFVSVASGSIPESVRKRKWSREMGNQQQRRAGSTAGYEEYQARDSWASTGVLQYRRCQ